jgi:hypothetical protein
METTELMPYEVVSRATREQPYAGPFPRKRHSHHCKLCRWTVACYKTLCRKAQRIEACTWCRPIGGAR